MKTSGFNLAALSEIAGVPRTLAQNWTTGRPLWVKPSVFVAEGRGTQNLFSIEDAYVLAALYELKQDGISTEHIAMAYQAMNDTYKPHGAKSLISHDYLGATFDDQDGAIGIYPTPSCEPHIRILPGAWSAAAEAGVSVVYCVLNFRNLIAAVDQRAKRYFERRDRSSRQRGDKEAKTRVKRKRA